MRRNQIFTLVKQELKMASRSKYIKISFILLPIIMWTFQGGLQLGVMFFVENEQDTHQFEGDIIHVVNMDEGNGSLDYGTMLVDKLVTETRYSESSLYKAEVEINEYSNYSRAELINLTKSGEYYPFVYIPENFTSAIIGFNTSYIPAEVEVFYFSSFSALGRSIHWTFNDLLSESPFTVFNVEHAASVNYRVLTYEGEEAAAASYISGLIAYLIIILTVMAPAPYVAASFAGEREKSTLESLLALPMNRFDVLIAKLLAGLSIISLFAISNIVGLIIFGQLTQLADSYDSYGELGGAITITGTMIASVMLMVLLTAFVALGIGIALASLTKDVSTSEGVYTGVMLIPAIVVGMVALVGQFPEGFSWLYFIPWMHSIAILNKGLYPATYADSTITGSVGLDLLFHFGFLFVFVLLALYIASKLFSRESILK